MAHSFVRKKKWSGDQIKIRQELASRLRTYRKSTFPSETLIGELSIVRQVVRDDYLREEPDLVEPRWVAYSYLSALKCTELFGELYLKAYRAWYERLKDCSTAGSQMPVSVELFLNDSRQINGLWRTRQEADRIGMPYEMFLNTVIGWGAEQKNRKHFPAPNQLYGKEQLASARDKWTTWRDTVELFRDDWDDRLFMGDEKAGPPRLKAMRLAYLRVIKSKHPAIALANLMGRRAIEEPLARRMFHKWPTLVNEAIGITDPSDARDFEISIRPYVLPCLGTTFDSVAPLCHNCPLLKKCELIWHKTSDELVVTTGSADPRAARETELARLRKRKQRAREREIAVTCSQEAA